MSMTEDEKKELDKKIQEIFGDKVSDTGSFAKTIQSIRKLLKIPTVKKARGGIVRKKVLTKKGRKK